MLVVGVRKCANKSIIIDGDVLSMEIIVNWMLYDSQKTLSEKILFDQKYKEWEDFQAEELGSIKDLKTWDWLFRKKVWVGGRRISD